MHAIILAAGVGKRLLQVQATPKCLLEFGGVSLLARHLDNLAALGIEQVTICVGYEAAQVARAVDGRGRPSILLQHNPLYTLGSCVSLWAVRQSLLCGDDILLMDADVLYHRDILARLVANSAPDCFLLDRNFIAGEEPVKICLKAGRVVEFRKRLAADLGYDAIGESVGFFKFCPDTALRLARLVAQYVADGRREQPHEEALRDLALAEPPIVGIEDITGLPWIEIDFPADVDRATKDILSAIDEY